MSFELEIEQIDKELVWDGMVLIPRKCGCASNDLCSCERCDKCALAMDDDYNNCAADCNDGPYCEIPICNEDGETEHFYVYFESPTGEKYGDDSEETVVASEFVKKRARQLEAQKRSAEYKQQADEIAERIKEIGDGFDLNDEKNKDIYELLSGKNATNIRFQLAHQHKIVVIYDANRKPIRVILPVK